MRPARGYTALVLAGRRGPDDALARAAGAPHRALLDVAGTPMLERVLCTLRATPCIGDVLVSIDEPALLERFPGITSLFEKEAGRLVVLPAQASPARSVLAAIDGGPREQPLLVTTADHALLTTEMVEHFLSQAEQHGGDVAVGLVEAATLLARFPDAQRTWLPFRGERFSGANLFAFSTPRARVAAQFWTRAEQFRKQPWRMVATFGLSSLGLFLLRRLDLEAAFERASNSIGARVRPVRMPQAEAAIDVDKLADLELVNRILAEAASLEPAADEASEAPEAPQEAPGEAPEEAPEEESAPDVGEGDGEGDPGDAADGGRQSARSPSSVKRPVAAS